MVKKTLQPGAYELNHDQGKTQLVKLTSIQPKVKKKHRIILFARKAGDVVVKGNNVEVTNQEEEK